VGRDGSGRRVAGCLTGLPPSYLQPRPVCLAWRRAVLCTAQCWAHRAQCWAHGARIPACAARWPLLPPITAALTHPACLGCCPGHFRSRWMGKPRQLPLPWPRPPLLTSLPWWLHANTPPGGGTQGRSRPNVAALFRLNNGLCAALPVALRPGHTVRCISIVVFLLQPLLHSVCIYRV
jgi:hypothetical protein